MKVTELTIPDIKVIEPKVFGDHRGFFMETWRDEWRELIGAEPFVQDNHSASTRGTLRGMHYQIRQPQGKLVRVIAGEVFDVAVDMRKSSATFGQWVGCTLSSENKKMMWVPPGFAHGFIVLSESAEFIYKCTDYYAPQWERSLLWSDERVGINWPLDQAGEVLLSEKDAAGKHFEDCEYYEDF